MTIKKKLMDLASSFVFFCNVKVKLKPYRCNFKYCLKRNFYTVCDCSVRFGQKDVRT